MSEIVKTTQNRFDKVIDALHHTLAGIRTGRANISMLDKIQPEYYGSPTPINQIAQVNIVEGRQLVIKPWDRSVLKDIEKAILASDLGITPSSDGEVVRLNVPALTEDRRKELTKVAHKDGEESKVALRNVRRDANDAIKKDDTLTEDMKKDLQDKVQKLTDDYVKQIDVIVADKTKEIMVV
ncbi:MAG: ribosome recycling factor [Erysipelotrichaceae bacterium]